jgi:hypothetical protein
MALSHGEKALTLIGTTSYVIFSRAKFFKDVEGLQSTNSYVDMKEKSKNILKLSCALDAFNRRELELTF